MTNHSAPNVINGKPGLFCISRWLKNECNLCAVGSAACAARRFRPSLQLVTLRTALKNVSNIDTSPLWRTHISSRAFTKFNLHWKMTDI